LLEALQSGQPQALEQFYVAHRWPFLRWSEKAFGLSYEEAVDIYQDAIMIVYEKITSRKLTVLESSLKTYLFAVSKNLILKSLRRREATQAALAEREKLSPNEEAEVQAELRRETVRTIVAGLPDPCKSILQLYYYQQLPLRIIADQLGYKSEDVAKVQKNRCMKSLRNTMLHLLRRDE
jgi:RNA polymerase sigma-70 factor (ECF subfamily)